MDSRKLAWVLLLIGAAIMGGTYLLYLQTDDPAARAQQADGPAQPDPSDDGNEDNQDRGDPDARDGADADGDPGNDKPEPAVGYADTDIKATVDKKYTIGSANPASKFKFQIEAIGRGASIYTLKLSEYQSTIADKELAEEFPETYDAKWTENPEDYKGPYSLLNPVVFRETERLAFATRAIYFAPNQSAPRWAWDAGNNGWIFDDKIVEQGKETLRFKYLIQRDGKPFLTVWKSYTVREGSYSFRLDLKIENHWDLPVQVCLDQAGPTGVPREGYREDVRQIAYGLLGPEGEVEVTLVDKAGGGRFEDVPLNDRRYIDSGKPTCWLGHMNKYFASIVYLKPEGKASLANTAAKSRFYYGAMQETDTSQALFTGLMLGWGQLDEQEDRQIIADAKDLAKRRKLPRGDEIAWIKPSLRVEANDSRTVSMDVFCGPKKRDLFSDKQDHPLYAQLNYLATIDVSSCCPCAFDFLAIGMMWLLQVLSVAALGNWGVAIILLVLIVRLLLHPLSKKSQTSMARMQKLAPQIKKVQEKYADDKATMQKEVMKIYREAGASPFLGCLPMFFQIPIWVALWTAVRVSVELRHAAFLPIWLTDLSTPDRLISFGSDLMLIGESFNLLPILLGVAMYLQMKLSPQMAGGAGATTTPEQQAQQKMMQLMMPGMMLLFFYKAPSGLTLYIMASTFVGVIESKIIRKHIREKDAAEAAAETVVQGPGKGARSARPKKPKGPFWHKHG